MEECFGPLDKQGQFIEAAVIAVLIFLIVGIIIDAYKNPCDTCVIHFKNEKIAGVTEATNPILDYDIPLTEIKEALDNGECILTFDRVYGWRK